MYLPSNTTSHTQSYDLFNSFGKLTKFEIQSL